MAGDLVHLLAELLDNALRYSPPISQVRVSAVHTGNGGLVIEVSDIGLGMTESDLRVANTRLQSGGEVNPYTARHMGLFVVGRLAAQHGLVVRLRSTIAGEPNSGTTAGVFVPAELLVHAGGSTEFDGPDYGTPADAHAGIATALALDEDHADYAATRWAARSTSTATPRCRWRCCRSAIPGASGISDVPTSLAAPVAEEPQAVARRGAWPDDSMPAQTPEPAQWEQPQPPQPTNTSAFFASRAQAASNGVPSPQSRSSEPAAGGAAGRSRAGTAPRGARTVGDGRLRRCDLPEDAVRMARRSARPGQQRRPELGVGVGSRLVGGRGGGGRARRRAHRGGSAGA